jgi:23S rRNA (guanosine2251-2'-O)-methyltransferase
MGDRRLIYGLHAVIAALRRRPAQVHEIFVDVARQDPRIRRVVDTARSAGVVVHSVDGARLAGFAAGGTHQGVVAFVDQPAPASSVEELLEGLDQPPLLLILDGVQDPHNLGACLRVADATGVHAVVVPKDRAVGLNPTVRKVASGAAESVPLIAVTNLVRTINQLKDKGIWIAGATDSASRSLFEARLTGPLAIILGAEGEGMRRLTRESCDLLVSIPMLGQIESLNVSVAAGVCLYEALRQRRHTR